MSLIGRGAKAEEGKRPPDPASEKWLKALNAHPARRPRPVPDPLPPAELVPGPFSPDWSAPCWEQVQGPGWLYDGKLGIGLHWGPSSLEGRFIWPAWNRYGEKRREFDARYGHPSNMGWKDVLNLWRAEKFDADALGKLFKASGFTFVAAQAAHHDRFDMFDSTYRPWNSVNVGPRRDFLKEWRAACLKHGLRFGITDHSDWSTHMAGAFGADKEGPWAGVPFDGRLTKADGAGRWWDGLDPVDFYGPVEGNKEFLDRQWYLRSIELIRDYQPDMWWQDGNFQNLPAAMARDFIASYYNLNAAQHGGRPEGVVVVKQHPSTPVLMTNYEIHKSVQTTPYPWMTDTTCYGPWFYDEKAETGSMYTAETLVHTVADIVSRNGTLLLNLTLRPDGTLPQPQIDMLEGFGGWMKVNGESIHGTRPWHVFCDNSFSNVNAIDPGAWAKLKPGEVRYTSRGEDTVYAIVVGRPQGVVVLTQLNRAPGGAMGREVADVQLLGWEGKLTWTIEWPRNLTDTGLAITVPKDFNGAYAAVFKVTMR
jgi:alpha-L-fucosidase